MKIQLNIENEKNESQAVEVKAHFEKFLKLIAELEETCRKNDMAIYEQLARIERRMDDLEFGIAAHVEGNPYCPLSKVISEKFAGVNTRMAVIENEQEELHSDINIIEEKNEEACEKLDKQFGELKKELRDHKAKTSHYMAEFNPPISRTLVASHPEGAGPAGHQ